MEIIKIESQFWPGPLVYPLLREEQTEMCPETLSKLPSSPSNLVAELRLE